MNIASIWVEWARNVQDFDIFLFHSVNAWCGNRVLDHLVNYEEQHDLLKGGIFLAVYWWFWFAPSGERWNTNRRRIIAALIGVFFALVAARALAMALPFRMRPMFAAGIGYHPPSILVTPDMEDWSSFPSDTATVFFALAFGIFYFSRPLGLLLMGYAVVWICLPRLYLGGHYPSDLVAGALLGVTVVWVCVAILEARDGALGRRVMAPFAEAERRWPQVFYAAGFLLSFEMAVMFDDIRDLVRGTTRVLRQAGYFGVGEGEALFLIGGTLLALIAIASVAVFAWRLSRRGRIGSQPVRSESSETLR